MSSKTKQWWVFFTQNDEAAFSEALKSEVADAIFIDDQLWPTPDPPLRDGVNGCTSQYCYMGPKSLLPTVTPTRTINGTYRGPYGGIVVQFWRGRINGNILAGGNIGAGYDAEDRVMADFVASTWKATRKCSTKSSVTSINTSTGLVMLRDISPMFVGRGALEWLKQDPRRLLKDHSGVVYYLPDELCDPARLASIVGTV